MIMVILVTPLTVAVSKSLVNTAIVVRTVTVVKQHPYQPPVDSGAIVR